MGREQILEILDDLKEQLDSKNPTVSMVAEVISALSKYDILSLDEALHIASNLAQIDIALDKIKNMINEIETIIKNSGQPEKNKEEKENG